MGNFLDFLRTGFFHVAPILVAAAIAVAIIVERSRALLIRYPLKDSAKFFDEIRRLVLAGQTAEALAVCDKLGEKPAARVVREAISRAHQPESLIEHGLQIAVGECSQAIQKRTTFLATIANVATLLGLFGTIAGLIHSFEAVGHADPQQKSALLAAGISQAMNATMLGLAVAIPCMIAFSFLMNRTNQLIAEIEHAAVRSLDVLKQSYFSAEIEALGESATEEEAPKSNGHARSNGAATARRAA